MPFIGNGGPKNGKAHVIEMSNRATIQKLSAETLSGLTGRLDNHESGLNANAHQVSNIAGLQAVLDNVYTKSEIDDMLKIVGTLTATASIEAGNVVTLVDVSTDSTLTMPDAALYLGKITNLKRIDATGSRVTVDTTSSQTIDGNLTLVLTNYQSLQLVSNGTNWFIL